MVSGLIRFRNGFWEVNPEGDRWIQCDCEADAWDIAASVDTSFEVVNGDLAGHEVAAKLEFVAALMTKYRCEKEAHYLREVSKLARGEPSDLDGFID